MSLFFNDHTYLDSSVSFSYFMCVKGRPVIGNEKNRYFGQPDHLLQFLLYKLFCLLSSSHPCGKNFVLCSYSFFRLSKTCCLSSVLFSCCPCCLFFNFLLFIHFFNIFWNLCFFPQVLSSKIKKFSGYVGFDTI